MKASAGGRSFEGDSWTGVLVAVLRAVGTQRTYSDERRDAARQLGKGYTIVIGGVLIKPEGARE